LAINRETGVDELSELLFSVTKRG